MNQAEWLAYGLENGVCAFHDGLPMTEEEDQMMVDGDEPCVFVIRLYVDAEHRSEIEANHSPSVWRR